MIDRIEEQIGKLMNQVLLGKRSAITRVGCPGEETLASYLAGKLSDQEKDSVEAHLADCADCLDTLSMAYMAARDEGTETVPQRILDRAMALVRPTGDESGVFDPVVCLVRDSLELVSTSGRLVTATAPVGIRGKGKSSDTTILQVEREMGKFRVSVEVERVEGELCQVAVTVRNELESDADGIRLSLLSRGREQASYLARQGAAIFDRIPPGEYRLAVSQNGRSLGSMRLKLINLT